MGGLYQGCVFQHICSLTNSGGLLLDLRHLFLRHAFLKQPVSMELYSHLFCRLLDPESMLATSPPWSPNIITDSSAVAVSFNPSTA